MKDIIMRIGELADEGHGFNDIFSYTYGRIDARAEFAPEKSYTIKEIKELFDCLYEASVTKNEEIAIKGFEG